MDGQNVTIEYRHGGGIATNYAPLAAELIKLNPAVLVVGNAAAIQAAGATSTIPIVVGNMTFNTAPHVQLIGPNLSKPLVSNVTGQLNADIGPKEQFNLIKELVPGASTVGYLLDAGGADAGVAARARADAGAAAAGVKLVYSAFSSADGVDAAVRTLIDQRFQIGRAHV